MLGSDPLRHAALTSVMVSGIATAISLPLALGAAYALVRLRARGRRVVYLFVLAALLLPLVALTGPLADQLIAFGAYDSRLALVPPALLITLPLAIWLCVTVFGTVSWSLLRCGTGRRCDALAAASAALPCRRSGPASC